MHFSYKLECITRYGRELFLGQRNGSITFLFPSYRDTQSESVKLGFTKKINVSSLTYFVFFIPLSLPCVTMSRMSKGGFKVTKIATNPRTGTRVCHGRTLDKQMRMRVYVYYINKHGPYTQRTDTAESSRTGEAKRKANNLRRMFLPDARSPLNGVLKRKGFLIL